MPPGMGGFGTPGGRGGAMQAQMEKDPPITHPLNVSLEDLFNGGKKKVRITKKIYDQSGRSTQISSDKEIALKPGWKDGTKITYEREGDETPGHIPADIVFVVTGKPHDRFVRDGDNLLHVCHVTLAEALTGVRKGVMSLDTNPRRILIEEPFVTPSTKKVISGEGFVCKGGRKGDLIVSFDIEFPPLSASQRQQISQILATSGNGNGSPRK